MADKRATVTGPEVKAQDPWKTMVDIIVPKKGAKDEDAWVCVNGKSWQIPRGKKWSVPEPVAEVLEHSEEAAERAEEFREQASKG